MSRKRAPDAALLLLLLLLALATGGAARPSGGESLLGTPNATSAHVLSSCPHIMKRLVTPQQISGAWYPWEALRHGTTPTQTSTPCARYVFGSEGERLKVRVEQLHEGSVISSVGFSYTQNSNGLWEGVEQIGIYGYQLGFASVDDSLLVLCSTSIAGRSEEPWEDVEVSIVLGREPTLDEAAVNAAVNQTALAAARREGDVVTVRPRLQDCVAPTPAPLRQPGLYFD